MQKDLHDPDNHEGVITHLEPDILECEVKWALESITISGFFSCSLRGVPLAFHFSSVSLSLCTYMKQLSIVVLREFYMGAALCRLCAPCFWWEGWI